MRSCIFKMWKAQLQS